MANRSSIYDLLILGLTVAYVVRKVARRTGAPAPRAVAAGAAAFALLGLLGCTSLPLPMTPGDPVVTRNAVDLTDALSNPATRERKPVSVPAVAAGDPDGRYLVGTGDKLLVNVFSEPGLADLVVQVDADGFIQLPILELVEVAGRTTTEIQKQLKDAFSREFKEPWVVVLIAEYRSQPVYLLGEFNSPGVVYLDRPTNVLQALGHGGGLTERAYLRGAHLLREGRVLPVDINGLLRNGRHDQNVWLEPEDTIFVPDAESQKVFVLGAVEQPGAVGIGNDVVGLVEALSRVNGPRRGGTAKLDEVRIIRSLSPTRGEFLTIDAERILGGGAPDVPLVAGDIVFVPQNAIGDWNDVVNAIRPSFSLAVSGLQPFVQLKVLSETF